MKSDDELREALSLAAEKIARQLDAHDRVYTSDFNRLKMLVHVWDERFGSRAKWSTPESKEIEKERKEFTHQSKSPEELALWVKNNVS
jgi:hypothetical protein